MNYAAHYDRLIARARTRTVAGYSERHHIVPRCMGGSNDAANMVRLTAPEHYVAHQLLVRMHPGNVRLLWAAVAMTARTRRMGRSANKLYGWLRSELAEAVRKRKTGTKASLESRAKMSAARMGVKRGPHSATTRAKMSRASKGVPKSAAHVAALSAAQKGKHGGPHSAEWKANQTAGVRRAMPFVDRSYMQAQEYRSAQSEKMKLVWAARRAPSPLHATQVGG